MDRNFARSLALVLKSEGGWSDNPADPGGATMRGVTIATFRRYIDPNGTKNDLRNISDAQLAQVYKKQFWDAVKGDDLPDGVDYAVVDFAINSGPGRAAKYLQMVVGVTQDGAIGPATLDAVRAKPTASVINSLCDFRLAFLQRLPAWGTFGNGWSSRVSSVRSEALKMAQTASPASAAPAPVSPPPAPVPTAPVPPAPAPAPKKPSAGLGVGAVGLIAALAFYWHELVAWVHHFF